jgi:hypothetical protein
MKSVKNPINLKGIVLFILCVTAGSLFGQSLPLIQARFANPRYDRDTKTYFLDVELSSKSSAELLFGMNLRFFYDASLMEFKKVDEFSQGYGLLGSAPKPSLGNPQSGQQLFSFNQAAAYVNGGVQLLDERFPLQIPTTSWVKVFRVSFKVSDIILDKEHFCPSVIWDLEATEGAGGFLAGSAGLVITVAENNRATRFVSAPSITSAVPFNWQYSSEGGLPYGRVVTSDCITVGELVATEDQDKTDANGYALFQNQPNPFDGRTIIEFILPYAQHASLVLYDVDGKVKEEIDGFYEAGRNQVELKQKSWMVESNVIYYRLQTDKYTSKTFTMSLVRA